MSLIRWLQALTVLLALLSTWMLQLGENEPLMAAVAAAVVAILLVLNDWYQLIHFHRLIANAAMIFAAFFSLIDFFDQSSHGQLIAIGELLVYVQVILLLQKKSDRIYGQVAIFSLLAVVVAALLTQSLTFGLLLLGYTVAGVFVLSLFSLFRITESVGLKPTRRRRPLVDAIEVRPSITTYKAGRELLELGVLRELTAVSLATLMFGATFFYTLPRIGGTGWEDGGLPSTHRVGFSPEITFNQMGRLLQNNDLVMRITFRDLRTGGTYIVITEPYMRGAVLTRYVMENGQPKWKQDFTRGGPRSERLANPKSSSELVGVDVLLEPTRDSRLFHIYPPYATRNTPDQIRYHQGLRVLFRQTEETNRPLRGRNFRYELATTAFRFGLQTPVTPHINPLLTADQRRSLRAENQRLLRIEPVDYDELGGISTKKKRFEGLQSLTKQIIQETSPNGNNYEKAIALQTWFLKPGRFKYTINFDEISQRRREALDPIEDFVLHHRSGHCQYFASAMVLMLRSAGIPARIAVGYRGGEYNSFGQYYLVKQSNAHAWVEAYMSMDEIPSNAINEAERDAEGGWLRLDPTPARTDFGLDQKNVLDRINDRFDYAQWLWNDYILKLTPEQQRASGFTQLNAENSWDWTSLLNPEQWQKEAEQWLNQDRRNRKLPGRRWWSLGFFAVAGVISWWFLKRSWPWRWPWRRRKAKPVRRKPTIVYYRRLEKLLRRFGGPRPQDMTPREFASVNGQQLAEALGDSTLQGLPSIIVEAYYQDRFRPDGATTSSVESAWTAMETLQQRYRTWRRQRWNRS